MREKAVPSAVAAAACLLCSTALNPLFYGFWWWFGPVLVGTAVASGTAAFSRLFRLPVAVGLILATIALLVTVTLLAARTSAFLGVVPTPGTLRDLGGLIRDGQSDMARLAAPVPDRPGLVVLTVIGTFLVAVIVDLFVVVLGRPTLAGLPLLGLFAVPAAVLPGGVGLVPFVLGVLGFVALILLDGRDSVRRWGHVVTGRGRAVIELRMGGLAGRIALGALAVAVLVPLAVPSLDGHGLVGHGSSGEGAGDGPSSASVVQPIVSLQQQLHADREVKLLTVRPSDPKNPQYLRLTALEDFDGRTFKLRALNATRDARIDRGLPAPKPAVTSTPMTATISVRPELNERYLPVPGVPTSVSGLKGDWRLAGPTDTIFSTRTSTAGVTYTVHSQVPRPTQAELTAGGAMSEDALASTALPADLDSRVAELASTITAGLTSPFEKVSAIQDYLRGDQFTYDLNGAPTTEDGALSQFLFVTKSGYCEQFASAMAVLVRALGLPARVAIGFSYGARQADGSWLVTNKDAHAWPEVWFPGTGWLPFEPTPRADGRIQLPPYAPASVPQVTPSASAVPEPVPVSPDTAAPGPDGAAATPTPSPAAQPAPAGSGGVLGVLLMVGLVLLIVVGALLLLGAPAIARLLIRRHRLGGHPGGGSGADAADARSDPAAAALVRAAWAELLDIAVDLGIPLRPSDSPRSVVARLTAYLLAGPQSADPRVAAAQASLARMAWAQERVRFAPPGTSLGDAPATIVADVGTAGATLWSVAPPSRRVLARVAPASVLRRVTRTGGYEAEEQLWRTGQPGRDPGRDASGAVGPGRNEPGEAPTTSEAPAASANGAAVGARGRSGRSRGGRH